MMADKDGNPREEGAGATLYRDFVYLDGEETMNALSALQGGEVTELVQTVGQQTKGGLHFGLKCPFVELGASGEKAKNIQQEVHLRQTQHAAISRLLGALESCNELRNGRALQDGDVVSLSGSAVLLPAKSVVESAHDASNVPPIPVWARPWRWLLGKLRHSPGETEQQLAQRAAFAEAGVGEQCVLAIVPDKRLPRDLGKNNNPGNDIERLVLVPCEQRWLDCKAHDVQQRVSRHVTVLGKVEVAGTNIVLRETEHGTDWAVEPDGKQTSPRLIELGIHQHALKSRRRRKPVCTGSGHETIQDRGNGSGEIQGTRRDDFGSPVAAGTSSTQRQMKTEQDAEMQDGWAPFTSALLSKEPAEEGVLRYFVEGATVVRPLCVYR